MRKLALFFFAIVACISAANAQDVFRKGDAALNIGVGFGGVYFGSGVSTVIPPLGVSFDYAVVSDLINGNNGSIGVGAYLGYSAGRVKVNHTVSNKTLINNLTIGVRGSFHYQFVRNLDTYATLMLGYHHAATTFSVGGVKSSSNAGALAWGTSIGARYYFSETFGVHAELGYGVSIIQAGITLRM